MTLPWYFILDLFFCGMAIMTVIWAWPRIGKIRRGSACLTAILVMPLQVLNEYLSLFVFKAWSFSFEHNRFIGWEIFKIPVEEYLFWFAFAWLIPFLYSGLAAWLGEQDRKRAGNWIPRVQAHE